MAKISFTTPILLLAFNRADFFEKQLEILAKLKPTMLYIAADGPREGNDYDYTASQEIIALTKQITWPCEVLTLFRQDNLGCRVAVSTAIDWFFKHEEEGIILEDDCLPLPSFFAFCAQLLEKYREQKQVMHISGTTFLPDTIMPTSYDFCSQPICWGWATWKRAWNEYDVSMKAWEKDRSSSFLSQRFSDKKTQKYWAFFFDSILNKTINTWDYQWIYTLWKRKGLAILPRYSLVKNIGFDPRATHTKSSWLSLPVLQPQEIIFPLQHPEGIKVNSKLDQALQKTFQGSWWRQLLTSIGRVIIKLNKASSFVV